MALLLIVAPGHISSVHTRTLKQDMQPPICKRFNWSHIFGSHENTETQGREAVAVLYRRSHIFGSHENTETTIVGNVRTGMTGSHIFGSHENTETNARC